MNTMTADPSAPAPEKKTGFRPSGLFMLVLLLGVIIVAEVLFFTVAHMLPDDRLDTTPAVKAPAATAPTDG